MIDAGVRAVFFDAVGTLLFPRHPVHRTYAEVGRRHGAEFPEEAVRARFRAAFARQEELDAAAGWRTDEDREKARWQAIVAEVLPAAEAGACFAALWDTFSRPEAWTVHPEGPGLLRELAARGSTVGIASNFDARLLGIVAGLPDLVPFRDRCVVSSLVGWRKPAPEFFAAVETAAGCDSDRILYVGDDLRNDIRGATAAGLRAVLYDPGDRSPDTPRIRRLRDLIPR